MADHDRFQALREEWSDLVRHYLGTDEGEFVLYIISEEERSLFERMLLEYADLISPNRECIRADFEQFRKEAFQKCLTSKAMRKLDRGAAEFRCIELRNRARDVASKVVRYSEMARPQSRLSDIPIPDEVNKALDYALSTEFDPDKAVDVTGVKDPRDCKTRRAPEEEVAELTSKARRTDDPPVVAETSKTTPAEASLKGIKAMGLKEVQRAYSQTNFVPNLDQPPFHASVHPASPPPAPEPGVFLGLESSIPPPPPSDPPADAETCPTEPVADRVFAEDDRESITGETDLSDDELNDIVEAEFRESGHFGPPSTPANQG
jgi:hypothetical protein